MASPTPVAHILPVSNGSISLFFYPSSWFGLLLPVKVSTAQARPEVTGTSGTALEKEAS